LKKIALALNQLSDAIQESGGPVSLVQFAISKIVVVTVCVCAIQIIKRIDLEEDSRLLATMSSNFGNNASAQLHHQQANRKLVPVETEVNSTLRAMASKQNDDGIMRLLQQSGVEVINTITADTWVKIVPMACRWAEERNTTITRSIAFLVALHLVQHLPDVWCRIELQGCAQKFLVLALELLRKGHIESQGITMTTQEMEMLVDALTKHTNGY
jgi:hypothetical protein